MRKKTEKKQPCEISAIVLARNEAPIIGDCLKSLYWVDELIVVDHCSSDETLQIAQNYNAKIIKAPENSTFSDRRNLGAQKAKGEWLLYVDADERVPEELRKEIELVTVGQWSVAGNQYSENSKHIPTTCVAFTIPRKNIRLTKVLYHGGWWPDRVLRLMRKDSLIGWEGELHEQPKINGKIGDLKEALIHYSHRGSFEHKLQNTINWSKIEAQKMFATGHPPMNTPRFLTAMWREFYKRMIKYQAYKDGLEGILEAIYQVFSVFISYARLWEMQVKSSKETKNESRHL